MSSTTSTSPETEATEAPVPNPMMPGRNGGTLRRGGGKAKAKFRAEFESKIKAAVPGVADELIRLALKGNLRAIEMVLAHGVGKPKETVEVIDVAAIARRVAEEEGIDPQALIEEAERLAADDVE